MAFFNPTDGYGLFSTYSATGCRALYIAKTTDGGARFGPLVQLPGCGASAIAFDDQGDGFVYGPDLYVSHDGGSSWQVRKEPGVVLSVEALGRSIWALVTECVPNPLTSKVCGFQITESTDGGHSWQPTVIVPPNALMFTGGSAPPGSLERISVSTAYVVPDPNGGRTAVTSSGTVPLWFTSDKGHSWAEREIPCGTENDTPPYGATLSVAPDGTLFAVCSYFTQIHGMQDKAVLVSTDEGQSWSVRAHCNHYPTPCSGGIGGGHLGVLDAVSSTTAFEFGQLGTVIETTDGGASWAPVGGLPYATGGESLMFFNASDGLVLADARL